METDRGTPAAAIERATVESFRASLRGELVVPGDERYDAARRIYNAMIDKHPALIVRCAGVADVIRAIHLARDNGLQVAVRGGGHNVAGNAVCDDGMVIDLSCMKGTRVDPVRRTIRVEGGVTWGELDREAEAFGLATTGGLISTTGVAGLTLGGGCGWLMRKYGLACDNLLSADVVTADGQLRIAGEGQDEDLFWAIRGGGGNFGVVTSFEYRLRPVGPVLGGMVAYPLARARDVLRFYREFTAAAPDELTAFAVFVTSPEGPVVAILLCYCGSLAEGEAVLRPLREFGPPALDTIAAVPYTTIQTMLDAAFPPGLFHYWRSSFLKQLSDDAIDTVAELFARVPSPLSGIAIEHLGGAVGRVGEQETAFSQRGAQYDFLAMSIWPDATESESNMEWMRQLTQAMAPFLASGVYVNYLGVGEGEARVRAAYGANYERLVALKNRYDPTNFFRMNHNIPPTV